jgi:hypothetical protein
MTEYELKELKKKVIALDIAEIKLERLYKEGKINEKKNKKIKKILNNYWIRVWDFHPDISESEKEFFKLNFG